MGVGLNEPSPESDYKGKSTLDLKKETNDFYITIEPPNPLQQASSGPRTGQQKYRKVSKKVELKRKNEEYKKKFGRKTTKQKIVVKRPSNKKRGHPSARKNPRRQISREPINDESDTEESLICGFYMPLAVIVILWIVAFILLIGFIILPML